MIPNLKISRSDGYGKQEAQKFIDDIYGEGTWELVDFQGGHYPTTIKHKCGQTKEVSRYSTFKLGKTKCSCEHEKARRPQIAFEEMAERVEKTTKGEYKLISYNGANNMIVRHNVGDCMKEFKTTTSRFFNRCQRCGCMVGRL